MLVRGFLFGYVGYWERWLGDCYDYDTLNSVGLLVSFTYVVCWLCLLTVGFSVVMLRVLVDCFVWFIVMCLP